jgi:hypothetical protein
MPRQKRKIEKPEAQTAHDRFLEVLRSGAYTDLRVVRYDRQCYLVMRCGYEERIFVNRKGAHPDYHHGWQIRTWLQKDFGIPPEAVPVVEGDGKMPSRSQTGLP